MKLQFGPSQCLFYAVRPAYLLLLTPSPLPLGPRAPPPPAVNVYLPKDRVTGQHQSYGFVELKSEEDADYAIKVLNMVKLFGKPLRVNKASQDKNAGDVGANLFIGNLDPDVDEKVGEGWGVAGPELFGWVGWGCDADLGRIRGRAGGCVGPNRCCLGVDDVWSR